MKKFVNNLLIKLGLKKPPPPSRFEVVKFRVVGNSGGVVFGDFKVKAATPR